MPKKRTARRGFAVEIIPDQLYSDQRVADFLRLSVRTLQKWRTTKTGPAYVKLGKIVRYYGSAILEFVKANERHDG